jgi:hypothetical protein
VVVQATSTANKDLPASAYDFSFLDGSVKVPGADRGWAYALDPDDVASTAGVIVVVGQRGLNVTVSADSGTAAFTVADLQKLGSSLVDALG